MKRRWFDPDTGALLLDDYVVQMPSFRRITDDEVVTDTELLAHTRTVVALLAELERRLPPDLHELATEALCELAVLNLLYVGRQGSLP